MARIPAAAPLCPSNPRSAVAAIALPSPAQHRRAVRVGLLLATIVVLSLADLYMTLAHLQGAGMGEANPLARLVISYQSPTLLAVWKCACVTLACLFLYVARHRLFGELACWLCCFVLTALTVHWIHYSAEAATYTSQINALAGADLPSDWVTMDAR